MTQQCAHVWIGASPAQCEAGITARRCRECRAWERVIVLGEIPPGANQLHRMSRYEIGELRARLKADAAYLVRETGVDGPPIEHARISVDFYFRTKRGLDTDNAFAGCKPVIDGLRGRWLVDDADPEYVIRRHTGTGQPSHVRISVEAI